ncbi:hypothetical protein FR932_02310 [Moritella marina ATCC 15381]|uniref:Uncharacterized protein n=1 Tax=Moritella marina ATCC 15381 TaxID=1202962 RepID=A0A5J6WFR4_MORMI|nr:hypothetical protein [Moritella marina]QFI36746.1 hypothetical protein FR932_02310 [Moritella marina ATCC 15381]
MAEFRGVVKKVIWGLLITGMIAVIGHLYWSRPLDNYPVLDIEIQSTLQDRVQESSALARFSGQTWTTNDSGDGANLYQIDEQTGQVLKQVHIDDAISYDWESLAQDEGNIFIMDCGNNHGTRDSRSIISVDTETLMQAGDGESIAAVNTARFSMADKPDTALTSYMHDYDCEAATVVEQELWVLSKNWSDLHSRLYRMDLVDINNSAAKHSVIEVIPAQTLNVDGLITAADYNAETAQLVLLGYDSNLVYKHPFIWVVPINNNNLNWDMAKRFNLSLYGQWESIIWQGDNQLLLTAEASFGTAARVGVVTLTSSTVLD